MSQLSEINRLHKDLERKKKKLEARLGGGGDGGCDGGVHRYTPKELTLEMVETAERNTKRLRSWYENYKFKQQWKLMSNQERDDWFKSYE